MGLIRIGKNNEERFKVLNEFLNDIKSSNGNIAIPTYSYSYAKNKLFDIIKTPSELGEVSEYLRKRNVEKRTYDPNFSYLLFGDNFSNRHLKDGDSSSFGEGSFIEDIYLQDGYLGSIGGALEYLTEIHYIEKKLNMDYRFDKVFKGKTIDIDGQVQFNNSTFYCRDLGEKYNASFVQLKHDLLKENLIEEWKVNDISLKFQVIKFRKLFDFIKNKLINNPKYLWEQS